MEIKEKKETSKLCAEELYNGDVFKFKGHYYMKCSLGLDKEVECVDLESGDVCFLDWGVKVQLIKGEFVCQ